MDTTTRAFAGAHAQGGDWKTLVRQCLDALGALPEGANLGFLYVTDLLGDDFDYIGKAIRHETGIADWVGTMGFGICAPRREYFDTPAMAVLVAALPEDGFRIVPTLSRPGEALPAPVSDWVAKRNPVLGVVHGDPRNAYLPAIIHSLTDDTNSFLVGGLTASRGRFRQMAGTITEGGLSGVLFSEDVVVASGLSQGCSPIGPVHEVTRAKDNVVLELDGRTALDVFREDIGEVLSRDLNRIAGYIHAALPIAGTDTGDYLVRNVMGIDPQNGWIAIGERLSAHDKVMFVRRDGASAMSDLERMADNVARRADGALAGGLYYSCVARGPNLFGRNSEELTAIGDRLGDVPLVGFYANGEISNSRLYGYTGVLTVFT